MRAAIGEQTKVVAPAFTCESVPEAIVRSGGRIHLIDAGDDGLLMDEATLSRSQTGPHAAVLCEVYGHTYDLDRLALAAATPPVVRIVDMATSVPRAALFRRLRTNDFAVISFGKGKSMYAGWGAMGFTNNQSLAMEVKRIRDAVLKKESWSLSAQRILEICLFTIACYPSVYPVARRVRRQMGLNLQRERNLTDCPKHFDRSPYSPELMLPSTHLDRALGLWVARHVEELRDARVRLADRYHNNLATSPLVTRPRRQASAMGCYAVRVSAASRSGIAQRLLGAGIKTDLPWKLASYFDENDFPNTRKLSNELLNLPLWSDMSMHDVDLICDILLEAFGFGRKLSKEMPAQSDGAARFVFWRSRELRKKTAVRAGL